MSTKIIRPRELYQRKAMAHKQVVEVAKGMASAIYEELMKRNDWWELWKDKNPGKSLSDLELAFVARTYPSLLEQARATLAELLNRPINESLKEQIYDALLLDNTLEPGRRAGAKALAARMKMKGN